jgi:hypothetical protein
MQNSVILVRGSAGLKLPSELNVKGSARIDTDSSATARVDVDERVNNDGETAGTPKAVAAQKSNKAAPQIRTKQLRASKARIFIGSFLDKSRVKSTSEDFGSYRKAGGGATGLCTLVQPNIAR